MRVRITSGNLLSNPELELYDGETPTSWETNVNGVASKNEWVLNTSQTLYYPERIEFVNKDDDFFNTVKVVKSATVKGDGVYQNIPAVEHTLTSNYKLYEDSIGDTDSTLQDRYITVDSGGEIYLSSVGTSMVMEVDMLFTSNFSDTSNKKLRTVRNSTGRELKTTSEYMPLSTSFSFINCEAQANAISSFFLTCIKYGVGYKVEAFITPETAEYWGKFLFGNSKWGGFDVNGEYVEMFTVDTSNFNHNRASATGEIAISAVLQKSEVNNVYLGG